MPPVPASLRTHLKHLREGDYRVSDICDMLQALKVPHAGYLPSVHLRTSASITSKPVVAVATTVRFASKSSTLPAPSPSHFADVVTAPDTIAVLSQPEGQRCAVLGGLVAKRLQKRGVMAAVVAGRVRDIREIEASGWSVWSEGVSAVGAGAEAKVVEIGGLVVVQGVEIAEGDVVFADQEGVAVIPRALVGEVVESLPPYIEREGNVLYDIGRGKTLTESLKHRRSKA